MSATIIAGQRKWSASSEKKRGHRTYKITHMVRAGILDGPAVVGMCAGLPLIGSVWNFDNDLDLWAYCTPAMKITPMKVNEPNRLWEVENIFSTDASGSGTSGGCLDDRFEDPLLEPDGVSGIFGRESVEAIYTMTGALIETSAHERIRGIMMDDSCPSVRIQQNRASLGLSSLAAMKNTLNDAAMWGVAARCVKLSNITWERKILGTCSFYYTRVLDFDINPDTFDLDVPDYGTMAVGQWKTPRTDPPVWEIPAGWSADNPQNVTRYKDPNGENCPVFLDGTGKPATSAATIHKFTLKYYDESNFLLLEVPTSF